MAGTVADVVTAVIGVPGEAGDDSGLGIHLSLAIVASMPIAAIFRRALAGGETCKGRL